LCHGKKKSDDSQGSKDKDKNKDKDLKLKININPQLKQHNIKKQ
jgi:hypothetical protein